jgi:superfamily II DNA or RNA helicase
MFQATLALTPAGALHVTHLPEAAPLPAALAAATLPAFQAGPGGGLLTLAAAGVGVALPQPWAFWRDFAARCLTLRLRAAAEALDPTPPLAEWPEMLLCAPPMEGGEYLDAEALSRLWGAMLDAYAALAAPAEWLAGQHPSWRMVGRVHLNLAVDRSARGDPERPFAFLATYTTRLSAAARPQHAPLGKAVREASASGDRELLLSVLKPLQTAAAANPWLQARLTEGALYAPVRFTPAEAEAFLREVPALERLGLIVRMPEGWRAGRPARPVVTATIGSAPVGLDTRALLDFQVSVVVEGTALTPEELRALLAGTDGLQLLRGQWVEVDRGRLERALTHFRAVSETAAKAGLSFLEATRLLAGGGIGRGWDAGDAGDAGDAANPGWSEVLAGPWLRATLSELRSPEGALAPVDPGPELSARLRPYQRQGVAWLHLLVRLGLGACLADDMGLGKTLQILALCVALERAGRGGPTLVVVPTSLLGNWQAEAQRFAPALTVRVAHASAPEAVRWTPDAPDAHLVVTTYGTLVRDKALAARTWRLCVLDEAQAIKNPGTRQTRAVKAIRADARIALTGTPVENRLGDLWSLMDFLNPGLLGTAAAFGRALKRWAVESDGHAPLRRLVSPYLLRRKKTDRSVISDLPDKVEMVVSCGLSRRQAALYQEAVDTLARELGEVDGDTGVRRRGVVLAALMRMKQICNHPSQWLGDGAWAPTESGKLLRLAELAAEIASRQEKLLVFTQFRQVTQPLQSLLGGVFGREGLVLHGETTARGRTALVERFQGDPEVPYMVLSLKAGGTGLNLTAASHVVHFDRWWNPAVEDQATDRAFRIGQVKNVMVHKFVCRGTVEERIDALIQAKRALAGSVVDVAGDVSLTEMSDAALLAAVSLDLGAALEDDGGDAT